MQGLEKMNVANRLLLVQGISLIENGLQFFEWLDDYPNEATYDALNILRDRVQFLKEYVYLDAEVGYLLADRATSTIKGIEHGYKTKEVMYEELKKLRKLSVEYDISKERERSKELRNEILKDLQGK